MATGNTYRKFDLEMWFLRNASGHANRSIDKRTDKQQTDAYRST